MIQARLANGGNYGKTKKKIKREKNISDYFSSSYRISISNCRSRSKIISGSLTFYWENLRISGTNPRRTNETSWSGQTRIFLCSIDGDWYWRFRSGRSRKIRYDDGCHSQSWRQTDNDRQHSSRYVCRHRRSWHKRQDQPRLRIRRSCHGDGYRTKICRHPNRSLCLYQHERAKRTCWCSWWYRSQ